MLQYRQQPAKIDELIERSEATVDTAALGRLHWLVNGVIRHLRRLEDALGRQVKKPPRDRAEIVLLLGLYELWEDEKSARAQVVNFVTEQAKKLLSKPESGFVNAVLRRAPETWPEVGDPGLRYSHPAWLAERWQAQFGPEAAEALMAWDQKAPELWIQMAPGHEAPATWQATDWPRFYKVPDSVSDARPALEQGIAYIQDPATRHPVELAEIQPGMAVLDLCASPGGKSWQALQRLGGQGSLFAVDMPARAERLRRNLQAAGQPFNAALESGALKLGVIEANVLELEAAQLTKLAGTDLFDVVLLDVPCSNTGVLRRRPDAKWRLQPKEIDRVAELQQRLLQQAARFVKPGGTLVYSTCSIEPQENEAQVETFLAEGGFTLQAQKLSRPDLDGHDGGGAFRLTRYAAES
ncbi:MAG: RsmB/NOP family class I SAM-dependent RNA methyltransferase [Verrucomicrobiota bacterium JB022]|nr:RsmB/NOP family class I SAM-dependent RNA methyltransferase [Verrucomicrobiota bacterium JB022]